MRRVYFDHNATTPLRPEVLDAMLPFLTDSMGNPSSLHSWGRAARDGIDAARRSVARALGCLPAEVHFTSGGTEADNWAIKGVAAASGRRGRRIVTSAVEHYAVLHVCRHLKRQGYEVAYVPVDACGTVDPDDVAQAIDDQTMLISVMHANNETGSIQPVEAIGELAWSRGIPFHVDAVQSFGKIPVRVDALNADLVTLSAHKIYGPKGVGALYVRQGMDIEPLAHGGGHEEGRRAGTENVAGIVGLGRAAELKMAENGTGEHQARRLRDRLEQGILARLDGVRVNGHPARRLGNTLNISLRGVEAEGVVLGLDLQGIAAASGSACASGETAPSHVLLAMGLEPRLAAGAVRFSLGQGNSEADVDYALEVLPRIVERLRQLASF